jgi:hypothetical protein
VDVRIHEEREGSGQAALPWPDLEARLREAVAAAIESAVGHGIDVGALRWFDDDGRELPAPGEASVVLAGYLPAGTSRPTGAAGGGRP